MPTLPSGPNAPVNASADSLFWRLDGGGCSLVLVAQSGALPRLVYFGESLPKDVDAASLASAVSLPLAHASVDNPVPASVFPMLSTGHGGPPAMRGHRGGTSFGHRFDLDAVEQSAQSLALRLRDAVIGLRVVLNVSLDASTGVCAWHTTLHNHADTPLQIDWLASASIELPVPFCEAEHFGGRWGQELQCRRTSLDNSPLLLESWRGRTGHQSYPGLVVGEAGFDSHGGQTLIAHMAWSGNHRVHLQRDDNGVPVMQFGVGYHPGECELAASALLETPVVYLAVGTGRDQARQRLHRYARCELLPAWTREPRAVHCNSWEALYFNHDLGALKTLIDAAAEAGAERFVLDDGWFHGRRNDSAGLGDWGVDPTVYPDGLHPVVDYARQRGLQFGLWFEPEMVNPDSDVMRLHPEWCLRLDGVETPLARQQLALDVSRSDVQAYLIESIASLVETYQIDYIKWDMNRDLVLPGDGQFAVAAQQPDAVRLMMQQLLARFPTLEIESCASGGGRLDWGMLGECGRVWLSDNLDPIDRMRMQCAATTFLPSEVLGSHVGHARAHLTGRRTTLSTRAIVALGGQFGFETDLRGLAATELAELGHYTSLYKTHRQWLAEAVHWSVVGLPAGMLAEGRVAVDGSQALYSVLATSATADAPAGVMRLAGLANDARYTVEVINASLDELAPYNRALPRWCLDGVTLNGSVLAMRGVQLPIMPAHCALLLHCKRVS